MPKLPRVETAAAVSAQLAVLGVGAESVASGAWRIVMESAGLPLTLELELRGELLRARAAVLPPELIDPHQLLFWNAQAPLVCFAETRDGDVLVSGEIPVAGLAPELLDRFLGLLAAGATRARQFVLPAG
jgi:hypothetical protein